MSDLLNENEEIVDEELDEILSEREKFKIEKEAQAKATVEKFTEDPKAIIKAAVSQNTLSLINNDEDFKRKISKASESNANSAIDEITGNTRQNSNNNYYLGREEAIQSLGGSKQTSKDKQIYTNWIYTIWWYVLMTLLGIPFIAPLKVLLNWAKALSPTITVNRKDELTGIVTNEQIKRLHWLPTMFSLIFYCLYLFGLGYLIYLIVK